MKLVVRSSPKALAALIPLAMGSWRVHPGLGTAQRGHRVTQEGTAVLGSSCGDGMGWWGPRGDNRDQGEMVGTMRRHQRSGGYGGD